MFEFYLSLGSNLGDRNLNLKNAIEYISSYKINNQNIASILEMSSIYESAPIPLSKQQNFFNTMIKIESELQPIELLEALKIIEKELGRDSTRKNQSRIIDIDIIFAQSSAKHILISQSEYNGRLELPHPRAHLRAFVLVPLIEIDTNLIHPVVNKTGEQMLSVLEKQEISKIAKF
jgi:2-amino-4-hydroxy-6-hydroxymethyldihydropteridine diphosphokinase